MKRRQLILLCACLALLLSACGRQSEQPNDGVQPRNLTEEQAAGEQAGTENGAREAMVWSADQAEEEEIAAAQAFLDSLSFETVDYSKWAGGDLARAVEMKYCLL